MTQEKEIEIAIEIIENNFALINLPEYAEIVRIFKPQKLVNWLKDYKRLKEQESKTGHWIKYSVPRCGEQHYKCSACGYYINFGQWGELYTKEFKYCPNCKCPMIGLQEGEDK